MAAEKLRPLGPELELKARELLGETPRRRDHALRALRARLHARPRLAADDQWLVAFLRGCKYRLDEAERKLGHFCCPRELLPELCGELDPQDEHVQRLVGAGVLVPLPGLGAPGAERVILMRAGAFDPSVVPTSTALRFMYMLAHLQMAEDDNSTIAGHRVVLDVAGAGLPLYLSLTPSLIKKIVVLGEDVLPFRQVAHHIINLPSVAETIIGIFRYFASDKGKGRIHLHKTVSELHKHIPRKILPTEYGGEAGPIQDMIDHWKRLMGQRRAWLVEVSSRGAEETPPQSPSAVDISMGSFRQLCVD